MIIWYGDEAGRWPLAGPLVCAWIGRYVSDDSCESILHMPFLWQYFPRLVCENAAETEDVSWTCVSWYRDSKRLTEKVRNAYYYTITQKNNMFRPASGVCNLWSIPLWSNSSRSSDFWVSSGAMYVSPQQSFVWSWGRKDAASIDTIWIVRAQRDALFSSLWRGVRQLLIAYQQYIPFMDNLFLSQYIHGDMRYSQKSLQRVCAECSHIGEQIVILFDGLQFFSLDELCSWVMVLTHWDIRAFWISLASIVAKVTRDQYMYAMHKQWPSYGFDAHKGYGTRQHRDVLTNKGPTPLHRKTFLTRILH